MCAPYLLVFFLWIYEKRHSFGFTKTGASDISRKHKHTDFQNRFFVTVTVAPATAVVIEFFFNLFGDVAQQHRVSLYF